MKKIALSLALACAAMTAGANCVGTGALRSCYDSAGNGYTVNRIGNTTTVSGYNANTGSNWSQQSSTYGNSTLTTGQTNGRAWNQSTTTNGNTVSTYGTNSLGQPFQKTCTAALGCF